MTTIACLSPFTEEQVRRFAGTDDVAVLLAPDPPAPEVVREIVADADVVIGDMRHKHRLDRDAVAAMARCRLIHQPAVGFDAIDHRAAAEYGIPVANAAGYNRESVADWTVMAMLNVVRHGARRDRDMRAGLWAERYADGRELGALTVGIVGAGNIGRAVAVRLSGFGSRLLLHDPYVGPAAEGLSGAESVASLEDLLAEADVVTVHVPLDHGTRGLLGEAEMARMRPGTVLVNASRGPVVDEHALVRALSSGHLGGAALDVYESEPLAADSPLRRMDNVFLSPHVGGGTREARQKMFEGLADNIRRVLAGDEPVNVVNAVAASARRTGGRDTEVRR